MLRRILNIIRKEFIQALRDPRLRLFVVLPPMVQLIIYGYAINFDIKNIATAVYDEYRTPESRELIRRFQATDYFDLAYAITTQGELKELLDRSRITLALRISPDFARHLKPGRPSPLQLVIDGTDSNAALVVSRYANTIITDYHQGLLTSGGWWKGAWPPTSACRWPWSPGPGSTTTSSAATLSCPGLAALPAAALQSRSLADLDLEVIQSELPQTTVHSILQSRDGYLWVSTYEGVVRTEGITYQVFDRQSMADGLAANGILAMHEDSRGALWFGTEAGLSRYDGANWKTFTTADGLAHDTVTGLLVERNGVLWASTGRGVSRFDGTSWSTITRTAGIGSTCIIEDREGNLWFAGIRRPMVAPGWISMPVNQRAR